MKGPYKISRHYFLCTEILLFFQENFTANFTGNWSEIFPKRGNFTKSEIRDMPHLKNTTQLLSFIRFGEIMAIQCQSDP